MNKYTLCMVFSILLPLSKGWAMQVMDDSALAQQTGQDGITVSLDFPNSTISYSELAITDTNGMSGATGAASLVLAPTTYGTDRGIRFFNDTTANNLATQPVTIKMDADGNSSKPVLNTEIGLPTDLRRIRINPFSVYLANGSGSVFDAGTRVINATGTVKSTGVREILRVGTNGIDINFLANNPVKMNVQLGNAPQGHMFMFTSGSITQIKNDPLYPIEVMSNNLVATGNSSLKLNFDLSANNMTTGISLVGFYGDIIDSGLVLGKAGTTDKFNLTLSNIVAGTTTAAGQSSTSFNNLKNASIGTIGLVGASVTNLKMTVKGL